MSSNRTQFVSYESFLSRKTLCLKYCVEFSCRRHLKKINQAAFLHIYKNKDEMNFPPPVRKSSTSTYQWNSMRVTQLNVFVTSLFSRETEKPPKQLFKSDMVCVSRFVSSFWALFEHAIEESPCLIPQQNVLSNPWTHQEEKRVAPRQHCTGTDVGRRK